MKNYIAPPPGTGTHIKWPEAYAALERERDALRGELATTHTELADAREEIDRLRDEAGRLESTIRDLEWSLSLERSRNND